MSRCSFVKTLFGVISLFLLLSILSGPVEARDYHIQASDGEVYTVTLSEEPGVHNFSFQDADGEILRCVTEDERVVATELYFAAKFFWNVLPWYLPENEFEDWEATVNVIAKDALDKLGQRQIATMVAQHSVTMLLIIGQPNLFAPGAADVISNINGAIAGELERAVLLNASFLAQTAGRGAVKHERILRGLWSSYETRSLVIPIDEINDASESDYKAKLYLALASRLVSQYLQVPNFEERISTFIRSIVPFANKVETLASITYSNEHLQDLRALRENSIAGIHRSAKFQVYLDKRKSRSELEEAGFFHPIVDTPLEDIRISIEDDPQRLDVRDYFSPQSDNLLYVPRADDESVAVARTETIGSSVIIITPQNTGRTSVEVTVVGPRDLSVTTSFTVTVGEDIQPNQVPEPDGTIDHQLLLIDSLPQTLDMAEYFSWDNDLDYEADSDPSGIVEVSVSGSQVTLKPRQIGNASVIVTAYDKNDRGLYAVQTIPVLVYTDRATIVRPPSPTTFNPPTTSNPSTEGLARGVSVITQLDPGVPLNVRKSPGKNAEKEVIIGSGVTGIIIGGPADAPEDDFKWWKVRLDASGIEGWCVEWDRGQILYRRPPDLEIQDFKVSDDKVKPGEDFRLEAEIRNNGPGDSEPTEIFFYYRQSDTEDDVRVAGKGKVDVPSLREGRSREVSLTVTAPMTPHTAYDYGAILPPDIPETYDADLVDPTKKIRLNNVAEESVNVTSSPDLIVESIAASKSIVDPGESFTLDVSVRNRGLGEPEYNAILDYYRSSDAYISTRDREVGGDVIQSDDLKTNEIASESIRLSAPSEPGIYYYGACVDLRNESDTDNNCSAGVAITVRETNSSDLVVSLMELSDSTLAPGGSFTLEAMVSNQGTGAARPTMLRGYRSANASISTNDTEIGSLQVGSLNADAIAIHEFTLNAPLGAGTYYYGVSIDSVANEGNTANNNSAGVTLTVENLTPVASGTLPPQALVVGDATMVDISPYFSDPNEDILTYYVFSDAASVVVVEVSDLSNSELTLTPFAAGNATITVEVSDGEFTATQTIGVSVTGDASDISWMPDANLRAAVRKALGLTPGDVLTQEAVKNLRFLDASVPMEAPSVKINDLTGLEHATQLVALSLWHNEVVDVSPLSGLAQLTSLDLRENAVVDVRPLSVLTQLSVLKLQSNQISDVSALEALVNLEQLFLEGNPISDLVPLRRLKSKNPDLSIDINISVEVPTISEETWMPDANLRAKVREALGLAPGDVLTQEAMQGLTELDASMLGALVPEKINHLTGLEHATQLTVLNLAWNDVVDISPLSGLTQLTELDLEWNDIVDVSPLSGLTQLTELHLNGNGLSDISPLSGLTQLTKLDLFTNDIVDVSPLSSLTQLTWLYLGNDIVDISPLSGLTQLTTLYLGVNRIVDISVLSGLTQLTYLYLGDNDIVDISPLSGLTQLTTLYLFNNEIADISPLSDLEQLTKLHLLGNPISDLSPLRRLKSKNPDVTIDIDIDAVTTAVSEEIWMPDANLRAKVREALGLAEGDALTKVAMRELTELDASVSSWAAASEKISDLTGLEHATQLRVLYLWGNEISDISALSDLTQLIALDLSDNEISDISALSDLTQLIALDLWGNDIIDISVLSGLRQLIALDLRGNDISDISVLSGLNQLTELDLRYNDIIDISVLSGLTQLTTLYLSSNEIIDISVLSGLTQLTTLSLWNNDITDISALSGLTQLTDLRLSNNDIIDISVLSGLTQLTRLDLGYNELTNISVLSGLNQLTELYLGGNDIIDISVLSGLTQLTTLSLWNNEIIDISVLSGLTQLTTLGLGGNEFTNISVLSGLNQLTDLRLGGNEIIDISVLSGLTQLTELSLWNNEIIDISVLSGLTQLTRLDLSRNEIIDISVLSGLTQLTRLDLSRNEISDISPLEGLVNLNYLYLKENPIADLAPLRALKAKNPDLYIDIDINADVPAAPAAPTLSLETALLPNYPNPFNPETWIPYQLSKPADVTLSIYSVDGKLVRTLALGHQIAGIYQGKSRAAYWDGRNNVGERVASGIYFYTFTAGNFTATRKMLIRK